jgi:hypothetical protein
MLNLAVSSKLYKKGENSCWMGSGLLLDRDFQGEGYDFCRQVRPVERVLGGDSGGKRCNHVLVRALGLPEGND